MRIWTVCLLAGLMSAAHANEAPEGYVSTHPDHGYQQRITQKEASAAAFFKQYQTLRQLLDQDLTELGEHDTEPSEAMYWVCVRINQLYTLFNNNRQHAQAFNRQFSDRDFHTMMDYWHSDNQSKQQLCYDSEVSYSDRP